MRKLFPIGLGLVAVAVALFVTGDHYLAKHTTKIDDQVSLVTLDEFMLVVGPRQEMRIVRVKPDVTPPKNVRVAPPTDTKPKQPTTKQPPAAPKQQPAAPKPATVAWTLPYSCADVRWYGSKFSKTQLEAMRVAAGMALPTAEQRVQIQMCLTGKIK